MPNLPEHCFESRVVVTESKVWKLLPEFIRKKSHPPQQQAGVSQSSNKKERLSEMCDTKNEEGKDASGEAHERDKRQRRSRGVRMCVSWSVPDAEQRLQGCRSSSMTGQLAAQRVHVLWEKYWLAAWQDE